MKNHPLVRDGLSESSLLATSKASPQFTVVASPKLASLTQRTGMTTARAVLPAVLENLLNTLTEGTDSK